jgi:hypothetical protein
MNLLFPLINHYNRSKIAPTSFFASEHVNKLKSSGRKSFRPELFSSLVNLFKPILATSTLIYQKVALYLLVTIFKYSFAGDQEYSG